MGLALLAVLLFSIGVSKFLAARRKMKKDLEEIEAELEHEPDVPVGLGRAEGDREGD